VLYREIHNFHRIPVTRWIEFTDTNMGHPVYGPAGPDIQFELIEYCTVILEIGMGLG
jgi:hypothetical protein